MDAKRWRKAAREDGKRKASAWERADAHECSVPGADGIGDGSIPGEGAPNCLFLGLTPLLHPGHIRIPSPLVPTPSSNTSDKAPARCWDTRFLHLITLASKTVFLNALPEIFPFVASSPSTPCFTISRSFE